MTFRPFRNVIVCHMVPGSEDKVGPVFAHYDQTTRPQNCTWLAAATSSKPPAGPPTSSTAKRKIPDSTNEER